MSKKHSYLTIYLIGIVLLSALVGYGFERNLYSKTVEIAKGDYFGIGVSVKANETYTFKLNSSTPIDLVVISNLTAFNESFFANDSTSVSYLSSYAYFNVTEVSFNFTSSIDERYYFIVENADFFTNGAIGYANCAVTIYFSQIIYSSPGYTWLVSLLAMLPFAYLVKKRKYS